MISSFRFKKFSLSSLVLLLFLSQFTYSQYGEGMFEGRFGLSAGGTNYVTDTNMFFSKSAPGFSVAVVGSTQFSDKFELLMEINYSHNNVTMIGRSDYLAEPEDIKFSLDKINVPMILNYNFLNIKDEWFFGVELGPSFSLLNNFTLVDQSKEDYYIDPYYIKPEYLEFDTQNETISINVFAAAGLSAEYKQIMCNLRYYTSITDPYRNAPVASPYVEFKGKDSAFTLSLTYFFDEKLL